VDSRPGIQLDPRKHRNVRNHISRVPLASGALCALLVMPGCMIDRVYKMRTQMCDTEDSVQIAEGDGVHVSFLSPVIHAEDVKWLSGVQPHSEAYAQDQLTMRYIVSKTGISDAEGFAVPIDLGFRKIDGDYKLAQVDVTTELPFDFGPERIDRITASACENDLNPFTRQVALTLAPEDLEELPERDEVISLVGTPVWASDDESKLRYEFSIAGTAEDTGLFAVNLEYDQSGTRLLSMTSSYSYFRFSADFQSGVVSTAFLD